MRSRESGPGSGGQQSLCIAEKTRSGELGRVPPAGVTVRIFKTCFIGIGENHGPEIQRSGGHENPLDIESGKLRLGTEWMRECYVENEQPVRRIVFGRDTRR